MEICAQQPKADNRSNPESNNFVHVDEVDLNCSQSQGQHISSQQVRTPIFF
jgi:hypothetical protein